MSKIRRVVLLCLLAVMVAGLTGASAKSGGTKVTKYAGFTMFYNGSMFYLQDSAGEYTSPIVQNGTTYVPVCALEKLIGKSIVFDSGSERLRVGDVEVLQEVPVHQSSAPSDITQVYMVGEANRSQTILVTEYKDVSMFVNGEEVASLSRIYVDTNDVWVPLRDISNYVGLVVEWNSTLRGVDIYSPSFYSAVSIARKMDPTVPYIPVDSTDDALGLRAWVMFNLVRDTIRVVPCRVRYVTEDGSDKVYMSWYGADLLRHQIKLESCREEIKSLVENLQLEGLSPTDKVMLIAAWILDECEYLHSDAAPDSDIYARMLPDVFHTKYQICEGYARLFREMCECAGINAQYIVGYILGDDNSVISHAWNRVFIDGQWLYCDLTFADGTKPNYDLVLCTEEEMSTYRTALIWDVRP